jgi:serine/threonine protein kinase
VAKCTGFQVKYFLTMTLRASTDNGEIEVELEHVDTIDARCGSYGGVLIYTANIGGLDRKFAIKYHNDADECESIEALKGIKCGQIEAQCLKYPTDWSQIPHYLTIMPMYDGGLNELMDACNKAPGDGFSDPHGNLTIDICKQIASDVHTYVSCLHRNGQLYFDIKPANTLYLQEDGKIRIAMGDLGSNKISTYYCPEFETGNWIADTLQWLIIVFYADLRGKKWRDDYWRYVHWLRQMEGSEHEIPLMMYMSEIQETVRECGIPSMTEWFDKHSSELLKGVRWTRSWEHVSAIRNG